MRMSTKLYSQFMGFCLYFIFSMTCFSQTLPHQAKAISQGNITCSSSTCHGSISPWNNTSVLQNEYTTWRTYDKHSQAYKVLFNKQSQQIAKNLGLSQPAHEAALCLNCHAHNPEPQLRAERFSHSDGVGCEGCHGPAEKWISTHTVKGVSHADNVANGMYPTTNPAALAKLCNSCHVGDESRFVTHRIMGAGHPRMSIEINTFTKIEPPHYKVDSDYLTRKGAEQPVKLWAVGQATTAKSLVDLLADTKRNHDGIFPELVAFDCHACHHPMSNKRWVPRNGMPPGVIRLNDSSLMMLSAIVKVLDPNSLSQYTRLFEQLNRASFQKSTRLESIEDLQETAKKLSKLIEQLIVKLQIVSYDEAKIRDIFLALVQGQQYYDYASAEQAYMALTSVANLAVTNGSPGIRPHIKASIDQLRKELSNEDKFQYQNFNKEYGKLVQILQLNGGVK